MLGELSVNEPIHEVSKCRVKWTSQAPNVVKLFSDDSINNNNEDLEFGICLSSGHATLIKSSLDSPSSQLEVSVKALNSASIKYLTRHSAKYLTNLADAEATIVQFSFGSSSLSANSNCTDHFENFLALKRVAMDKVTPFRCSASLYTQSGKRLDYMSRLLTSEVTFYQQHWSCNVSFVANANTLLYELIERNIDDDGKKSAEVLNRESEPTLMRVHTQVKLESESWETNNEVESASYYQLAFIPAFLVQTKQVELPIVGKRSYSAEVFDAFSLVIKATRQLHSHLILTTNCPQLVKIKQSPIRQ